MDKKNCFKIRLKSCERRRRVTSLPGLTHLLEFRFSALSDHVTSTAIDRSLTPVLWKDNALA